MKRPSFYRELQVPVSFRDRLAAIGRATAATTISGAMTLLAYGYAEAQNYSGRIGEAGASVPTTTAMTGATENTRTGIQPPKETSGTTIRQRIIIGTTIGRPINR